MEAVVKYIKRDRRLKLGYVALLLFVGLGFQFNQWELMESTRDFFKAIGVGFTITGIALLLYTLRNWKIQKHKLFHLCTNEQDKVVWVFHYVVMTMPFGVHVSNRTSVYIYLEDGTKEVFRTPMNNIQHTIDSLKPIFNNATFGYSVEKEQLFRINPEMLRRERDF